MKKIIAQLLFLVAFLFISRCVIATPSDQLEGKYDLFLCENTRIISNESDLYLDIVLDDGNPGAEILAVREGVIHTIREEKKDGYAFVVEVGHKDGQRSRYHLLDPPNRDLQEGNEIKERDLIGFQGKAPSGRVSSFQLEVGMQDKPLNLWELKSIDRENKKVVSPFGTATYNLKVAGQEHCIDIPRHSRNRLEELATWKMNGGDNQLWTLQKEGEYYKIKSFENQKVITAATNETTGIVTIVQDEENNSDAQLWRFTQKDNNRWSIQSKESGKILKATTAKKLILSAEKEENEGFWELFDLFHQTLSPEEMKSDMDFYLSTIERTHPNMYAYATQKEVDDRKKEVSAYITQPRSYPDFYRKISEMNSLFDGHTQIFRSGENFRYTNFYRLNAGLFFPLPVSYEGDKIYLCSTVDGTLVRKEIETINTVPADSICRMLNKVWNFENKRMSYRNIEREFGAQIHAYLGIRGPWFEVLLKKDSASEAERILAKGKTAAAIYGNNGYYGRTQDYSFRMFENESIALIEYNACPMGSEPVDQTRQFMEASFGKIREKNIQHVFIDITRNGGGGGDEVNKYLYNQLNHEARNWKSTLANKQPSTGRIHTRQIPQCTETIKDGYAHKVYLIQSCLTYSAAVGISAWFKFSGRGVILGEETGGTTAAYVYTPSFVMPNSQINFRVSNSLWSFPFGARLDQGILPDIPVEIDLSKPHYEVEDLKRFISDQRIFPVDGSPQ